MKSNTQHKAPPQTPRPTYRSLEGWALAKLIENHAVTECGDHGHRRDKADPETWNHAREEAWRNPFPGKSPEACLAAIDEVMRSIGDTCPDCD